MKKLMLFFVAVLIAGVPAFSQGCLPEGITFSSQAQINSFPANYPDCTVIEGSALILGEIIPGFNLKSISGLASLRPIPQGPEFGHNIVLTSLSGTGNPDAGALKGAFIPKSTGFFSYSC